MDRSARLCRVIYVASGSGGNRVREVERMSPSRTLRAGFNMMQLTSIACREFEHQNAREQRKLLELVVSTAIWKDGRLELALHEPLVDFGTFELCKYKKTKREIHFSGGV